MKDKKGKKDALVIVKNFAKTLVTRIKKMDKRVLLMIIAAIALVIIILALIIRGISANKEKEPSTDEPSSNGVVLDLGTDADAANTQSPQLNGAGKYRVDTGFDTPLNMRLAANRNSAVLTTIPTDTVLEVMFVDDSEATDPDDYGWGYVSYNGERGWVYMEYLKAE